MFIRFFASTFFFIISLFTGYCQSESRVLDLGTASTASRPKRFYIAQIQDDRGTRANLGTLLPEASPVAVPPRPVAVTLTGGTVPGLERFLKSVAPRDTAHWAIAVRVKTLQFAENLKAANRIEGKLTVSLEFDVVRNGTTTHLTQWEGGSTFTRSFGATNLHLSLLRQTLEGSLRYLDQWLGQHGPAQEALARRVRVTFLPDPVRADVGDTVYYNVQRPLVWDDFRGPARTSEKNTAAAVFTSFGYDATVRTMGGVIEVVMAVHAFQLKKASWVLPTAKNDFALRHEQLHFDITKLVAERFKQALRDEVLPPDDYDSRIQYLFLESFREMNRLQQQYDGETAHSLNRAEQARWDGQITAQLQSLLRNP